MAELPGLHADHVAGQRADEMDIVADEDERAFERHQSLHQRVHAGQVQVRGGLVHQQQIGRVKQQFHQRQPAFFAAAEHADRFEDVVPPEQKAAQYIAHGLFGDALRRVQGLLQHRICGLSISARCCAK